MQLAGVNISNLKSMKVKKVFYFTFNLLTINLILILFKLILVDSVFPEKGRASNLRSKFEQLATQDHV